MPNSLATRLKHQAPCVLRQKPNAYFILTLHVLPTASASPFTITHLRNRHAVISVGIRRLTLNTPVTTLGVPRASGFEVGFNGAGLRGVDNLTQCRADILM